MKGGMEPFALEADAVHAWVFDRGIWAGGNALSMTSWLTPEEQEKAERYRIEDDQCRFRAGNPS